MTRTRSVIQGFQRTFELAMLLTVGALSFAHAQVPPAERAVLIALYESTNGDGWTDNTGWNGAVGTECTWVGIRCYGNGDHVNVIVLGDNNLVGSLPPITDLTELQALAVYDNELNGPIPVLAGLVQLGYVGVFNNQLSGPIPSLAGLTGLHEFFVANNQLSGPIPPLSGLPDLESFWADANQLSGPIPSLTGMTNLQSFSATENNLSGPIPSLEGLANLYMFQVRDNQLSGNVPEVPDPSALIDGASRLCPNAFNPVDDPAWDAATGATPWHQLCEPLPDPVYVDGFDLP